MMPEVKLRLDIDGLFRLRICLRQMCTEIRSATSRTKERNSLHLRFDSPLTAFFVIVSAHEFAAPDRQEDYSPASRKIDMYLDSSVL